MVSNNSGIHKIEVYMFHGGFLSTKCIWTTGNAEKLHQASKDMLPERQKNANEETVVYTHL